MSNAQIVHLTERNPRVAPEELVQGLVPPPHFEEARFATYIPDPAQPTQTQARDTLDEFCSAPVKKSGFLGKLFGKKEQLKGVYLDGGYGVGKTHLLASAWHASPKPATFGTFVEYTNLIGALGFQNARDVLTGMTLVCIDEFELDDPGDTVMMSRLMRELTDAGVRIVATSNTLPGALGQGRFAAQDFIREIQALSDQFSIISIDGDDYRQRGLSTPPEPRTTAELDAIAAGEVPATSGAEVQGASAAGEGSTVEESTATVARDDFTALLEHLPIVHPSKYRRMLEDVDTALWDGVGTIENEGVALRFVALVDRMYDRGVTIVNSGARLDAVFTEEQLAGGYKKKYMRCLSRLTALSSGEAQ
ncbi:cell division protein ZapE [Brevibacterium litoralis]|uniref:cell division protein ZapE n=1 Tax=Brevibacterium litoralis TaxID=3138935 RepID=UPI0032EB7D57